MSTRKDQGVHITNVNSSNNTNNNSNLFIKLVIGAAVLAALYYYLETGNSNHGTSRPEHVVKAGEGKG